MSNCPVGADFITGIAGDKEFDYFVEVHASKIVGFYKKSILFFNYTRKNCETSSIFVQQPIYQNLVLQCHTVLKFRVKELSPLRVVQFVLEH